MKLNWEDVNSVRLAVERYYKRHSEKGNINIPMYDAFVTEVRKDFERAGFDLENEADLFKLWGSMSVTLAAVAHLLQECDTLEEVKGALKVIGVYGNMTGMFLREMTKNVPSIPAVVDSGQPRPAEDE